ncbi:cell wall protein IFF6-like [Vanessa cardui]|uniref:cell wall protein IFF6-like n=1 Tax=Vanessa cardui TaxID=171605 RepID=UPI001F133E6D|nr:cell wall protein IFF6-like [Vanessa cardui]
MCSKYILVASFVFACVFARPSDSPPEKEQPTVIPILSQSDELESNGTYKFSYETGNGIKREEIAYEKILPKGRDASSKEKGEDDDESDEIHVQQGSYSYTAPDGTVITVRYIADENGFQPIGDHLPRSPVPSPALSNSAEKSGRALKSADSADSASTAVEAKIAKPAVKKPTETVMVADDLLKTVPITKDSKTSSSDAEKSETKSEGSNPEPANINVSTEVASTEASAQSSTEAPASVEQTSTSAPEQSAEVTETSSSTSAPEQSSSSEAVGQSTTTEAASQSPAEEVQNSTTNAASPAPVEGSDTTTVSA